MDYDIKANITTILTFILMPVLASFGVDAITGNAVIGALAVLVFYAIMYLNERYLSKIFTKSGYSVVKDSDVCVCPNSEAEAINQEYSIHTADEESDEGA